MKITASGTNSVTYKNALAHAKRKANKECYSFKETVFDAVYGYYLNNEEATALEEALTKYCKKNLLFIKELS